MTNVIEYREVPGHPECKKSIFEPDDDNCFFSGGFEYYSPLCSYDTAQSSDIWLFPGTVVEVYERLLIIHNGEIIYRNPQPRCENCEHRFSILSKNVLRYTYINGEERTKTHFILYELGLNQVMRYWTAEEAEQIAAKLSLEHNSTYIVVQAIRKIDRILGY